MERRLAAILSADIVGYSRLMSEDEAGTLARLEGLKAEILDPLIEQHSGRVVKLMGDGFLVEFGSVVDALECAVSWQHAVEARAELTSEDRAIRFRIGVNIGDVIVKGEDVYGDGVNVAARLEGLAEPGEVLVSSTVADHVKGKIGSGFEDLGEQKLKNIPEPVHMYRVVAQTGAPSTAAAVHKKTRFPKFPVIAAGLAVLILAAGAALWLKPWEPREEPASEANMAFPLPDKPSIAVLPFSNMSEDQNQEYFTDGMTEDLITDLSKISGLFVIARNSSFSYKGQQVAVRQVAEELGVRYVLEGSVRRAGDQVRINVQLIDATTGGHLWAERYDGTMDDVFHLQDQVTEQIVAALAVSLTGEEQVQQARHDTENATAHDAYLQGWARYKLLTPEDLKEAIPYFEEALRLDPEYAQAHAALASLYWDVFENDWAFDLGIPSARAEERANTHLEEALKNPTPLAHILQSKMFASWGVYDDSFFDDAVLEAEKAVTLDENDATALAGLAEAMIKADRPAEGLDYIEQAMRLDPHHPPSYLITLGAAQFGMERFEEAAATFERAVKRNPDNELPLIYLAASYGHLGRIKEGDAMIEAANDLRDQAGMGDLSLERDEQHWWSPFEGEIDFKRFGGRPAQERLRAGLSEIPALKWQYLVIPHWVLGAGDTWWEVEGAIPIDVTTAKSMYDRGVVFIFADPETAWKAGHIPGTVHLPRHQRKDPTKERLTETTLMEIVDKSEEVVFYGGMLEDFGVTRAAACAKALTWGFTRVYYFGGGLRAWNKAGYPVETAQ